MSNRGDGSTRFARKPRGMRDMILFSLIYFSSPCCLISPNISSYRAPRPDRYRLFLRHVSAVSFAFHVTNYVALVRVRKKEQKKKGGSGGDGNKDTPPLSRSSLREHLITHRSYVRSCTARSRLSFKSGTTARSRSLLRDLLDEIKPVPRNLSSQPESRGHLYFRMPFASS